MRIGRPLAACYRWIEYAAFGRALECLKFANLDRLGSAGRVLILGEGDGRTLARAMALAPSAHFDVIDVSPEMIALAQKRAHGSGRVTFLCQDALTARWLDSHYDAIVTNFFLDCFGEDDARGLILRLARALRPRGIWLIAEFAIPAEGWRRVHARIWIATMYRFFRLTTGLSASALPPIQTLLPEAGMQRASGQTARAGMMISEVWIRSSAPVAAEP